MDEPTFVEPTHWLQMDGLLKSIDGKGLETDEKGNPFVYIPASSEALDQDGQIILQRALTGSADYFMRNGVISWDHRHLKRPKDDPKWNPSENIIGEPVEVVARGRNTYVKAKLYKSNAIVQDIVKKLQDGSTVIKSSVGGIKPQVILDKNKSGKAQEKVVSVLWNEVALTFKPVNDRLAPVGLTSAAFLKSMELGYTTDPAGATGGAALATQDLEGAHKKGSSNHVTAVVTAMSFGDVKNHDDAKRFLKDRGCSDEEADKVIQGLVERKKLFKGVIGMDADLQKSFDDSITELEKALGGKKDPPAKPKEGDFGYKPEGTDDPNGDGTGTGDAGAPEGGDETPPPAATSKSLLDEMKAKEGDFLDAAPFMAAFTKAVSDKLGAIEKSVNDRLAGIETLQKSVGQGVLLQGKLLKSLQDAPAPRQSTLDKKDRTFMGANGQKQTLTKSVIMQKAMKAVEDGKIDPIVVAKIEDRLHKGLDLDDEIMQLITA